jgi:putative transposase
LFGRERLRIVGLTLRGKAKIIPTMELAEKYYRKHCKRYNVPNQAHELTFSCYHGQPLLEDKRACEYLAEAIIQAMQKHNFDVWAYVFMPEHVHLLIWPRKQPYSISAILQTIKQSVSRKMSPFLKEHLGTTAVKYQFWQPGGGYDRNIHNRDVAIKAIEYIHLNPVRRKLANHPKEWYYSSYKEWMDLSSGPIAIQKSRYFGNVQS